jgi:hypothetical protein
MSMNEVKQITQDAALQQVARQQATASKEVSAPAESRETDAAARRGADIIEFDPRRRDDALLEENANVLLGELPEVRADRVEEARRKLESGFYDRPEVLTQTAQNIQDEMDQTAALEQKQKAEKSTVDGAQRRLGQGYYDQTEVLDETARRIVNREI